MTKISTSVSVIIPTFNSWSTLKSCISSIQNQSIKPQEIIVVDNGSSDNTSVKVKKIFPKVKLITLNKNTGVTGGRNAGIKKSSINSNFWLFLDHDMVADKRMIEELIKITKDYPQVGIVTPKIYYWGNKKRIWSAGTGMNLWTGRVIFRGGDDIGQYEKVEEVQVAPAAILVTKEAMKKIKSFDDVYFASYEDTDFCFEARKLGFKTFYAPQALAYHILSFNPKDDIDRVLSRSYWIGRNRVIFMKRYGRSFPIFLFFLVLFGCYYLMISILNNRIGDGIRFLKGTTSGLLYSLKN